VMPIIGISQFVAGFFIGPALDRFG
jgi:hypothetical protein